MSGGTDEPRLFPHHTENGLGINCNEVMTVQTTIIVTEKHPPEAGDAQTALRQVVTDWLMKELYK